MATALRIFARRSPTSPGTGGGPRGAQGGRGPDATEGFGASGRWSTRRRLHSSATVDRSGGPIRKVASMHDAIAALVRDGDTVAIEGFTHLIGFAAGHEIIRQRRRDLTLARMTPDVIYDQMIAAGVARKLVFSWLGNPGVGGLGAIRRRIEASSARHAARGRGVQPLRDGGALHGRRHEPAVLPAAHLLRDGPAGRQPADPADPVALRRRERSTRSRRSSRT